MTRLPMGLFVMLSLGATGAGGHSEGAQVIPLPEPARTGDVSIEQALEGRRSVRSYAREALPLAVIGQLAWAAQGVTDSATGFRAAPSAGATFPLEIDLLIHGTPGLDDGVYRYIPRDHALRQRLTGDRRQGVHEAALQQAAVLAAPVVMVISAVMTRTEARYGPRAERYVHMEAGHAAQNVSLQGVALEVGSVVIGAFDDAALAAALQLDEAERPLYVVPLGRLP